MTQIDPNTVFTSNLLRDLTAALYAQPDETEAEYAERFAAATIAYAAFGPRDAIEQFLAVHIVAAQYAGLDCLSRAMAAGDPAVADRQRRSYAAMNRAMATNMRLLEKQQQRPAEALAPPAPAIEPVPALRPRPPAEKPEQIPMQREKSRMSRAPAEPPEKHASKMTDAELNTALTEMRALYDAAINDPSHPAHEEAKSLRPEDFPGGVIPEAPGATPARLLLPQARAGSPY